MNLLYICDEYPPGPIGGVGTSVQLLAQEMVKLGHQVTVIGLYSYSFGGKDFEIDNGVEVIRLRYGINLHLPHFSKWHKVFNRIPSVLKQHLNGRKAFARFIDVVNETVAKKNCALIELSDWNTFAMRIGFDVQWPIFKVPVLLKSHGSYSYFNYEMKVPGKAFLERIDRNLYQRADYLAAVSKYTASINADLFNDKRVVKVLYNGIKLSDFVDTPRVKNEVVFTGTLMKKKGVFELMQAWNEVHQANPEAKLHVYGKGPIEPLRKLLQGSARESVTFHGHVPRQFLMQKLSTASLAIFPSYSETFGLAVVEAMSLGCPVIYTRLSCGPEIVADKVEGELVDPSNTNEISETIVRLLQNEQLRHKYALAAYNKVKQVFEIGMVAQHHLDYYNEIIGKTN